MSTRCYVPMETEYPASLTIDGPAAHHLARVLRMSTGDALELFNGTGRIATAAIAQITKHSVTVAIRAQRQEQRPVPRITLVQALIRPQPMDWVVRKATELGMQHLQPVLTEHCVVRTRERPERWQKTLISAAEQCGANWLPTVAPVQKLTDWLQAPERPDTVYLCSLTDDTQPFKTALRAQPTPPAHVAVVVGPEGDFSPPEREAARAVGAIPVSLGTLTLRAETAALMAMAALRYEFDGAGD